MAEALRSKSGPTQSAYDKYGSKTGKGMRKGSFPIFDHKSAMAAIPLRGHASDSGAVLDRVQAWAAKNKDAVVLAAVRIARKKDAGNAGSGTEGVTP